MDPWWLSQSWSPDWSNEEADARSKIWLMSGVFFLPLLVFVGFLLELFGIEFHAAAIAAFFAAVPPSLYFGRRVSEQLWPDLVQTADANAEKRLGGRREPEGHPVPARSELEDRGPQPNSRPNPSPRQRTSNANKFTAIGGSIGLIIFAALQFLPRDQFKLVDDIIGIFVLALFIGGGAWVGFWWLRIRRMRRQEKSRSAQ